MQKSVRITALNILGFRKKLPEGELVSRNELFVANDAPEALQMKDFALGPHHEVVLPEWTATLFAFCAKKSEKMLTEVNIIYSVLRTLLIIWQSFKMSALKL